MTDDAIQDYKRQAAEHAVRYVHSGMVVGLGHGSTAIHALRCIAERITTGDLVDIRGVATSKQVEEDARALNVPLVTLRDYPEVNLTIDGADEVDPDLNVIKGGGGALLREKIVAQASQQLIIVADYRKLSSQLGTRFPVPLEVLSFAAQPVLNRLTKLGGRAVIRESAGEIFRTDQENWIVDWYAGPLQSPEATARTLDSIAGVLDHGLFLGMATRVVTAGPEGIRELVAADRTGH